MIFEKKSFEEAIRLWKGWNDSINVVSRKDIDNLFEHHILHSLAIAEYLDRKVLKEGGEVPAWNVLDVGTGGGFPGIPLAMVFPQMHFTLCDSIGKKVKVAHSVADALGLGNVECVNSRAEALPSKYDLVVSRAVTSLENFYPWVKDRFTGRILYLKGGDVNPEIAALCGKFRLDPQKITAWPISDWLEDDYFAEKFVIDIRK